MLHTNAVQGRALPHLPKRCLRATAVTAAEHVQAQATDLAQAQETVPKPQVEQVLHFVDKVIEQLETQAKTQATSPAVPHEPAVKLLEQVGQWAGAASNVVKQVAQGAAPAALAAGIATPWLGPACSLLAVAFKQWVTSTNVVPAAVANLRTCRGILRDILMGWDLFNALPDRSDSMRDAVKLLDDAVSECLGVWEENAWCRCLSADALDAVMKQRDQNLQDLRLRLTTQLLLGMHYIMIDEVHEVDAGGARPDSSPGRYIPMMIPRVEFAGRKQELQATRDDLQRLRCLQLWGGPGEGKTTMLRALSATLYEDNQLPGGAFEVDLTTYTGPQQDILQFVASKLVPLLKLANGSCVEEGAAVSWDTVEKWLHNNTRPVLVFFDNAEQLVAGCGDQAQAEAALTRLITSMREQCQKLFIVIASRVRLGLQCPVFTKRLGHLARDQDEAALLQLYCSERRFTDSEVRAVASACDHNCLMLKMAACTLQKGQMTVQQLVSNLSQSATVPEALLGNERTTISDHVNKLCRWWKTLLQPQLQPKLQKRFGVDFLYKLAALQIFQGSFDAQSASAVAQTPLTDSDLMLMVDTSVLTPVRLDDQSLPTRYTMHHLHREAAAKLLTERPALLAAAKEGLLRWCLSLGPALASSRSRVIAGATQAVVPHNAVLEHVPAAVLLQAPDPMRMAADVELPNIVKLLPLIEELGISVGSHPEFAQQLLQLAAELEERNFLYTAEPLYRRAVAEYTALAAGDASLTVLKVNSLIRYGRLLERLSKLSLAADQLQAALQAAELHTGEGDAAMKAVAAKSMDTLARTLLRMGRVQEARDLATKALDANAELHGGSNHQDTANSWSVLGRVEERMGHLDTSADCFSRALQMHEAIHAADPQHPDIANSLDSLGLVRQQQGRLQEALQHHARAWGIRLNTLGLRHHYTASSFDNLAKVFIRLGKLDLAQAYCDLGMDMRRETLGAEHPDVAMSLETSALLLEAQHGSMTEIERLRRQALQLVQTQRGPAAVETAACKCSLGEALFSQGKLAEAESMYAQAQEAYQKALGAANIFCKKCQRALRRVALRRVLGRLCCSSSS